ncbi:hypothetical protein [Janibacter sp. GXQ6167]|uniref:hypothetical protein n=1 Tax=Janibacter sp. GXQ6167 TaxID=3240791 RepID=UPI003524E93E
MTRGVLIAGMVGLLLLTTAGWVMRGETGGLSALSGALLAFGVILLGLLAMRAVISGHAGLTMAGAFVVYLGQLILLVAAIMVLREQSWVDGRALAFAAIVQTVALQVGQITGYLRARHEIYPQGGAA